MSFEIDYDDALNEAAWKLLEEIQNLDVDVPPVLFNNLKSCLKASIEVYLEKQDTRQGVWIVEPYKNSSATRPYWHVVEKGSGDLLFESTMEDAYAACKEWALKNDYEILN